jgi:hypothetical protein
MMEMSGDTIKIITILLLVSIKQQKLMGTNTILKTNNRPNDYNGEEETCSFPLVIGRIKVILLRDKSSHSEWI